MTSILGFLSTSLKEKQNKKKLIYLSTLHGEEHTRCDEAEGLMKLNRLRLQRDPWGFWSTASGHIYRVVELGWAKNTSQSEIKTEFQILLLLHQCRRKEHPLSKTQVITSLYNSREICSIHSWKHAAQHNTCTSYDYVKSNRKNK